MYNKHTLNEKIKIIVKNDSVFVYNTTNIINVTSNTNYKIIRIDTDSYVILFENEPKTVTLSICNKILTVSNTIQKVIKVKKVTYNPVFYTDQISTKIRLKIITKHIEDVRVLPFGIVNYTIEKSHYMDGLIINILGRPVVESPIVFISDGNGEIIRMVKLKFKILKSKITVEPTSLIVPVNGNMTVIAFNISVQNKLTPTRFTFIVPNEFKIENPLLTVESSDTLVYKLLVYGNFSNITNIPITVVYGNSKVSYNITVIPKNKVIILNDDNLFVIKSLIPSNIIITYDFNNKTITKIYDWRSKVLVPKTFSNIRVTVISMGIKVFERKLKS